MKYWMMALVIILCICGCAGAQAYFDLESGAEFSDDLDGDGILESWFWTDVENENGWEQIHRLTIISDADPDHPVTFDIETWMWYSPTCYLADLNNDGVQEILVSAETGEGYSYTSWCLNYSNKTIEEIMFADTMPNSDAYFTHFDGYIKAVDDNQIALCAYTDVLGTWLGCWRFEMDENCRLQPANEGWCIREFEDPNEEMDMDAYWEYSSLIMNMETAYRNGDEVGVLYPGDRILITGTDHDRYATFITEDGREGELYITSKSEYEFGWMVNLNDEESLRESNGYLLNLMDEYEFFSSVPYAG